MTEKVNNTFDTLDIMFDVGEMNYSNKVRDLERAILDGRDQAVITSAERVVGRALHGLIDAIDAGIATLTAQRHRFMALGSVRRDDIDGAKRGMTTAAAQYQIALRRSSSFLINLNAIKDSVEREGFKAKVGVLNQTLAHCSNLCSDSVVKDDWLPDEAKRRIESTCTSIDKIELPRYKMNPIELAYHEAVEAGKNGDASVLKRTYDRFGDVQIGVETPVGIVNGNVLDMIVVAWATEMATSHVTPERESAYTDMLNLMNSAGMSHSDDFLTRCEPLVSAAKTLQPQ